MRREKLGRWVCRRACRRRYFARSRWVGAWQASPDNSIDVRSSKKISAQIKKIQLISQHKKKQKVSLTYLSTEDIHDCASQHKRNMIIHLSTKQNNKAYLRTKKGSTCLPENISAHRKTQKIPPHIGKWCSASPHI